MILGLLIALAQDDAARLEKALDALQRERAEYYRRLDDRERALQDERRRLSVLERERKTLDGRREALESEVAAARAENAKSKAAVDALRAVEKGIDGLVAALAGKLAAFVGSSLPDDAARAERATPVGAAALERLESLRAALREELAESRASSLRAETVTLPDGRRKPARVGRVGHVWIFFVTEDGLDGGFRVREGEGRAWRAVDPAGLDALKRAVRILARQDAPGHVPLPRPEPSK